MCLKDNIIGWFLRPSSRASHILMADGIQDLDEITVRVNGAEKLLLFLRESPNFHLLMGEINQQYMMELVHY